MIHGEAVLVVMGLGGILLALGAPVGVLLALSSVVGILIITGSIGAATSLLLGISFNVTSAVPYLVIPMFILMGALASYTGIISELYDAAYKAVGRFAGGLAVATCLAAACFGAVTGSSISSAATMGKVALPEMRRFKYRMSLSAGAIAASGTFAMMLPPSIVLVFYGIIAEQSVGRLLIAGIIPGLITVVIYALQILIRAKLNPEIGPAGPKFPFSEVVKSSARSSPFLLVLVTLIGGILYGIWTPTEASAAGVFVVILIGIAKRRLGLREIFSGSVDAVVTSASVILLVIGSLLFSRFLALSGVTGAFTSWIIAAELTPLHLFLALLIFYIILGTFLEAISIMALTVPIILPIAQQVGWDPIWFGVVLVKLIEIGAVTPPVGLNLYALKSVAPDVPVSTIFTGAIPFWLCDVLVLLLLFWIPQLVLFLPGLM
jgi:C4-dicarboxylate transporter, DctM subunit